MKNLPHEIIGYLFDNYHNQTPSILINPILEKFNFGENEKIRCGKIKDLMVALETKGYLLWDVSKQKPPFEGHMAYHTYKKEFSTESDNEFQGLTNNHILATLTPDGLDYAIDIDRKKVQHRNNNLAIIFAALTVILSGVSLYKTIISQKELNQKQQQLQTLTQSLDSIVRTHRSGLNFLIRERRNDSIKNSSIISK